MITYSSMDKLTIGNLYHTHDSIFTRLDKEAASTLCLQFQGVSVVSLYMMSIVSMQCLLEPMRWDPRYNTPERESPPIIPG